jgi:adenine-specific DNA-methyltransferase
MNNERIRKKDSARLTWDSKPRRAPNPKDIEFQTAEVVIPNPRRDGEQIPISFRDGLFGDSEIDKSKMNRLIWGDNLLAMQALLAQGYEGKINLIYIDPPFYTGEDLSYTYVIEGAEIQKPPSIIERLAYVNRWSGGIDSFLDFMHPRLHLMRMLLAETGMIFVRFDYHVGHYIKILLDEIFGKDNFENEFIVNRIRKNVTFQGRRSIPTATDSLFLYFKSEKSSLANITKLLPNKREGYWHAMDSAGIRHPRERVFSGKVMFPPPDRHWTFTQDRIDAMIKQNKLRLNPNSGRPEYWIESASEVTLDSNWTDIPGYSFSTGYPTENANKLLERVIDVGSKEGDLIADFFCGSSTALVAAEKKGRRWIGCDLGKVAIQIARARLVEQGAKPFLIENIGNYQREMIYLTGGRIWEMQHLILKLYGATPRDKTSGLGVRNVEGTEELVYVGYPDRPITAKKAEELAIQAQKLDGRGYKRLVILGWDYEYNYQEALEARKNALKDKLKVQIESRDIPPDIYDYLKKAKTEEEIESLADKVRFYERPYLRMNEPKVTDLKDGKVQIDISIKRYVLMDIPVSHTSKTEQETYNSLMKLAKDNFAVLIDYWAVDWDYDGFTFKSLWQTFRGNGKKAKTVPITANETLEKKMIRVIAVRVVDIFGNDAGAIMELRT